MYFVLLNGYVCAANYDPCFNNDLHYAWRAASSLFTAF